MSDCRLTNDCRYALSMYDRHFKLFRLASVSFTWQPVIIVYYSKKQNIAKNTNKKLSCRREAARCFASSNTLLSRWINIRICYIFFIFFKFFIYIFIFLKVSQGHSKWHCWVGSSIPLNLCLYLVTFLRYSSSNDGVTLKSGVRVVQGRWMWRRSIDHIRLTTGLPL